jgi:lipopolysaccharide export system protein LptC
MGLDASPLEDAAVRVRLLPLALALALACTPNRPDPAASQEASRPQATLHGVRMRIYRGEETSMVGRAARLTFNRSTREVTAEESLLQFHPQSRPVEVRAPQLRGNLDARGADLSGGVRLRGPEGLTGETPAAHFDGPTMVASGEQPVSLRGPGYQLQARAFRLDFNEEAFDFDGDVATDLRGAKP